MRSRVRRFTSAVGGDAAAVARECQREKRPSSLAVCGDCAAQSGSNFLSVVIGQELSS